MEESKTYRNLRAAYDGELRAAGRYMLFARMAKRDAQARSAFREAAGHERAHAALWRKLLDGGAPRSTADDLLDAARGELTAFTELYRHFAQEAAEEGYHDIARLFERVADVERAHNQRFCELADQAAGATRYCADEKTAWVCRNCGHMQPGLCAPAECPLCGGPHTGFGRG